MTLSKWLVYNTLRDVFHAFSIPANLTAITKWICKQLLHRDDGLPQQWIHT